jgi:predicted metal-dependent enzyme (double-stranded beta helix superfamily)
LREFIDSMTRLVDAGADEPRVVAGCREAMKRLVADDDWLPAEMSQPHPKYYQQYLLYCDPRERFSVVSFVWGPGQKTPVHDHTVWGVIGMLRGGETCARFDRKGNAIVPAGEAAMLRPGDVDAVSPTIGDIHRVANAFDDRVSISVHAYGANIGRVKRHVFDLESGAAKEFVSGYANA